MQKTQCLLCLTIAGAMIAAAADDTTAAAVLNALTNSAHGIQSGKIANADCIAVIPGFKKGARPSITLERQLLQLGRWG